MDKSHGMSCDGTALRGIASEADSVRRFGDAAVVNAAFSETRDTPGVCLSFLCCLQDGQSFWQAPRR